MPVTDITTDPTAPTMTIDADFDVPVRTLWDAYADPRRIERFWGPVGWPATFTRHDMFPGGESHYAMTGPDGERSPGFWEFRAVDDGRSFEVLDGFRTADGARDTALPSMTMRFDFAGTGSGSQLRMSTRFDSAAQLAELMEMGMEDGTRSAMGQIDGVLAGAEFRSDRAVLVQPLHDDRARFTRVVRGSADAVWRAHHDPAQLQQWQRGYDGWTMPVCEVGTAVGDDYRYEWQQTDGDGHFGFTGRVLEIAAPHRVVTTESMIGQEDVAVTNELTLTALGDGTLVTLVSTYPDTGLRETILGTGMAEGMEVSYARLEREVLGTRPA